MLKKFVTLTMCLAFVVSTQAQGIKFGVHVDPLISFLGSDYSKVDGAGVNGGVCLGVELEYYFADGENYALTFGVDFSANNGGSLNYEYSGILFKNSELDNFDQFTDFTGLTTPSSGNQINIQSNTKINYSIQYLQIPIGLKLRTNELGQSYLRAFFHIPLIKIGVPVAASAKIFAADGSETDMTGYTLVSGTESVKEPNVWKDITPIQVSVGAGAGVEYSPNSEGGLRIYGGIYYTYGIIDVTNAFGGETDFRDATTPTNLTPTAVKRNPYNALQNVALRIGATF